MNSIKTTDLLKKRSFVSKKIDAEEHKEVNEGALVTKVASQAEGKQQAAQLALVDMSAAVRVGFRGSNAQAFIQKAALSTPNAPNLMTQSEDGSFMTLRLSDNEFWVLDASSNTGDSLHEMTAGPLPDNCYRLFCQNSHAWFMLSGEHIEQTMAKLCGVDLSKTAFPLCSIVQTSLARVNAVIVCHEINEIPVFSILSDSASAEYLWDCIVDAMTEFDGKVAGTNALGL